MTNYLIPLTDVRPFLKYIKGQGYDINEVEHEHLKCLWEDYCKIKVQQGEA